ncbi:hypothetical protein RIF29_39287 [Crotalaria pallida]|uniref:Uncharacterized protein n=1 Tax=Crotalaria pallida TaxID=3830 RepID=A0AAN9E6A7_CROPI
MMLPSKLVGGDTPKCLVVKVAGSNESNYTCMLRYTIMILGLLTLSILVLPLVLPPLPPPPLLLLFLPVFILLLLFLLAFSPSTLPNMAAFASSS